MKKYMVGYCPECGKKTKHEILESKDSIPWRIFEIVMTAGWALAFDHEYYCECSKCGQINTLRR